LEPIQPDFPWQPCQGVVALPEAQLLYAIIQVNWEDSNISTYRPKRTMARRWFFSEQFTEFCEHLNLNITAIRETLFNRWRKK
jgi:hypothetical protein